MKKFLKNIILLVCIVSAITISVNAAYIKLSSLDTNDKNRFKQIPSDIQICNFGSSHSFYGFNYEDYDNSYACFNFGLDAQYLSYDYRLFQAYEKHIGKGTVVFITVSYFSLFGIREIYLDDFTSKNKRYYSILPPEFIKEYDLKTDLLVRYFPALGVETEVLIKTLLGKSRTDDSRINWKRTASEIDISQNAKSAYKRHIEKNKYDEKGERIINQEEVDSLYNLIEACKSKGAIPILITTPYLREYTNEVKKSKGFYEQFYSIINQVISDTGVEYYDYGFDERFLNRYAWFMNADHLNQEGARHFSNIVMDEIIKEHGYDR